MVRKIDLMINKGEIGLKKVFIMFFASLVIFGFNAKESQASSKTYTVKPGDNLYRISLSYNTSVANLKSWNNLSSNVIYPKQKLVIGKPTTSTPATVSKSSANKDKPATQVKKEFTVVATAYTAYCTGCSGITSTGINLKANPNKKVIAVDPKVIPLGSNVYVEGYGHAVAGDIGSAIKGNKIDVFIPNRARALQWGRKQVKIQVLN